MKKTFSINAKGTLTNLLQSITVEAETKAQSLNSLRKEVDVARSCVNMVATNRSDISLA